MRKNVFFTILALALTIHLGINAAPVRADTATPSATPTNDINQVTDSIKARLQETLDNATTDQSATARAYVGTVSDIIQNTIVMQDKDGKKNIVTADDTVITRTPGNANIKIVDVQIGDTIIAIGYPTGSDEMTGKNIVVSSSPLTVPAKTSGFGTIATLTKTNMVVTSPTGDSTTVVYNAGTDVKTPSSDSLTLNDINVGDTIVYTADLDGQKNQTATIIMQVQAAPSPSPSVKPSPSPKVKPSPTPVSS